MAGALSVAGVGDWGWQAGHGAAVDSSSVQLDDTDWGWGSADRGSVGTGDVQIAAEDWGWGFSGEQADTGTLAAGDWGWGSAAPSA
ncbi:hypothetical protein [Kitasatospora camelliae]|uniref:Pentapeptide repeat protein n=1 Tax=Kitasatospora camelliae TaxID=3156397 RepID=A0AAU8JW16_9ACTN